jgi:hypothetical protein
MKQTRLRWNRHIDTLDILLDNTLLPCILVLTMFAWVTQEFFI